MPVKMHLNVLHPRNADYGSRRIAVRIAPLGLRPAGRAVSKNNKR